MGEINIPDDECATLRALDMEEVDSLIGQAVREERSGDLHRLRLYSCGPYVASKLRAFEQALVDHGQAKAPKKRSETGDRVRRAGSDLELAVSQMKQRLETEERERQLFHVDDQIMPPSRFGNRLSVRVYFRFRKAVDATWSSGSITVTHDVDPRPDYLSPLPKRKPSAAKREHDRQSDLYYIWEHLMRLTLYSVRDFFRNGGDGAAIPQIFQAIPDAYSRGLNNYSIDFWRKRP